MFVDQEFLVNIISILEYLFCKAITILKKVLHTRTFCLMILALQCDPNFVLFCPLLDYRERAAKDSAHLQSGPVAGAELRTVHQTSHRLPLHLSGLHGNTEAHDVTTSHVGQRSVRGED